MNKWLKRFTFMDSLSEFIIETKIPLTLMVGTLLIMLFSFIIGSVMYATSVSSGDPMFFMLDVGIFFFKTLLLLSFLLGMIFLSRLPLILYRGRENFIRKWGYTKRQFNQMVEEQEKDK